MGGIKIKRETRKIKMDKEKGQSEREKIQGRCCTKNISRIRSRVSEVTKALIIVFVAEDRKKKENLDHRRTRLKNRESL